MSSLAKLYEAPLTVGKQFALVITGLGADVREKASDDAHDLKLMQVYASHPVYAKCTTDAGRLHIEATALGGSNPRIYFLPWARKSIYRVRPKPGNTVGLAENLLFTPNLDGCMVTVDGKPESPTVYHANAAGMQLTNEEETAIRKAGEAGGEMENRLKIQKMAEDLRVFKKIAPKTPPPPSLSASKSDDFNLLEYDRGSRQVTKLNEFDNPEIEQESYYGAVFGVRKGGSWTFYKQSFRIYRKEWDILDKGFLGFSKPQVVRKKILEYNVVDIRKFWP